MRHIIGIAGVLASLTLAVVAAVMNFRFGYQLGKTEADGILYGSAAVAAGALFFISFFFILSSFQARRWGQAFASIAVMVVCGAYGLSSALGHAALNRLDRSGQREAVKVQQVNLEGDLKRATEELEWQPKGARGMPAVSADMTAMRTRALWEWSGECKKPDNSAQRNFCKKYFELEREFGLAAERRRLEANIADLNRRIAENTAAGGGAIIKASDPQSYAIAETGHLLGYDVKAETVALILMLLVPLMLEIGSSGGLYASLGMWGLGHNLAPPRPAPASSPSPQPKGRKRELPPAAKPPVLAEEEVRERTRAMLSVFWSRHMRPMPAVSTHSRTAYEHYVGVCKAEGEQPASEAVFLRHAESYVRLRTQAEGGWLLHGVTPVGQPELRAA